MIWRVYEKIGGGRGATGISLRLGRVPQRISRRGAGGAAAERPTDLCEEFEKQLRGERWGGLLQGRLLRATSGGAFLGGAVDPLVAVTAAFDLGIADATAIWLAQFVGARYGGRLHRENSEVGWTGMAALRSGGITMRADPAA